MTEPRWEELLWYAYKAMHRKKMTRRVYPDDQYDYVPPVGELDPLTGEEQAEYDFLCDLIHASSAAGIDTCLRDGKKPSLEAAFHISTAEDKRTAENWLKIQTEGREGHSSIPHDIPSLKVDLFVWKYRVMEKDRERDARASSTLREALTQWMRFDPPGMRADTKARISRAVQLYSRADMRSESKIAAEFDVSRKQVSTWFKTFTDITGFRVVTHKRHESVRNHVHGPEHREGRNIVFHGEDSRTDTHDAVPGKDPFFEER